MAKAFKFSLQKVLDVREMNEDKKAQSLQKAQTEIEEEKQKLAAIEAEKVETSTSPEDEDVNLHTLNARTAYLEQLNDQIENQNSEIHRCEENAALKRKDYIKASQDKMVLEKLRETHKEVHRKKSNQILMKEESEIAGRVAKGEGSA